MDPRAGALLNWYRLAGLEPPDDVVAAAAAQLGWHRRAGCRCGWHLSDAERDDRERDEGHVDGDQD